MLASAHDIIGVPVTLGAAGVAGRLHLQQPCTAGKLSHNVPATLKPNALACCAAAVSDVDRTFHRHLLFWFGDFVCHCGGRQVETLVGEVAQALPNAAKAAQAAQAGGDAPGRGELPSFREMRQLLLAQGGPQNLSSQVGRRPDPACIAQPAQTLLHNFTRPASSAITAR